MMPTLADDRQSKMAASRIQVQVYAIVRLHADNAMLPRPMSRDKCL
jgi:hypothetical protein